MLSAAYYCITRNIKTISIVFDLLLPLVLIFILLLIILALTAADYKNLLPIWNTDIKSFTKGCYYVMAPISAGYIYAFLFPYFNDYKDTKRYVIFSFAITTIIYSIIIMLCIMVFGDLEITYLIFPALTLSKSIQLDNQIFERAESLFMAAWIPNTFTTLVVHYLLSSISLKTALNIQKPKFINLLLFPIILFIAYLPQNISEVFRYNHYNNIASVLLTFVYFPIFVLFAVIRYMNKKKKQSSE
jgi:spore germination protein (amino acid permease)